MGHNRIMSLVLLNVIKTTIQLIKKIKLLEDFSGRLEEVEVIRCGGI